MKWFLLITVMLNMVGTAAALTAEAQYTHGVFHRGVTLQPELQRKLTGSLGEKISAISFASGATSSSANIKAVRFESKPELGEPPLNLWLYYDIAPKAKRNAKIDGMCTGIETDVPLKHCASLGRAMHKVIHQPKNKEK